MTPHVIFQLFIVKRSCKNYRLYSKPKNSMSLFSLGIKMFKINVFMKYMNCGKNFWKVNSNFQVIASYIFIVLHDFKRNNILRCKVLKYYIFLNETKSCYNALRVKNNLIFVHCEKNR